MAGMDAFVGEPVMSFDFVEQTNKALNRRKSSDEGKTAKAIALGRMAPLIVRAFSRKLEEKGLFSLSITVIIFR